MCFSFFFFLFKQKNRNEVLQKKGQFFRLLAEAKQNTFVVIVDSSSDDKNAIFQKS